MKQTLTKAVQKASKWMIGAILNQLKLAIGAFVISLFGKGIDKFQTNRAIAKERKLAAEVERVQDIDIASEPEETETTEQEPETEIIEETEN